MAISTIANAELGSVARPKINAAITKLNGTPPSLSGRNTVTVLGDSIGSDAFGTGSTNRDFTSWGYVAWFRRYMGNRIKLSSANIYAVAGATINDVLTLQLPTLLSSPTDVAIIHCGTNSLGSASSASLWSDLQSIYDQCLANGIFVVALPIRAHNSPSSITGNNLLQLGYLNQQIKAYARSHGGVMAVDPNELLLDYSTGDIASGWLADGIHDNTQSAIIMGRQLATACSTLWPGVDDRFIHLGDAYDATYNPTGNRLTNGLMAGTSGTAANGATSTGSAGVASNWRIGRAANSGTLTVAGSKEAISGYTNLSRQVITFGGTADGNSGWVDQEFAVSGLTGIELTLEAELTWNIASGSFYCPFILLQCYSSGFSVLMRSFDGFYTTGKGYMPTGADSGVFRTEPIIVPSSVAYLNAQFGMVSGPSGACSATLKASRFSLRSTS